jgi:3-mercaptopyruvate sulfurtransferase SseA
MILLAEIYKSKQVCEELLQKAGINNDTTLVEVEGRLAK